MCLFNFGGMLTGAEIEKQVYKKKIYISDFNPKQLNPNSYNLRIHNKMIIYKNGVDKYKSNIINSDSNNEIKIENNKNNDITLEFPSKNNVIKISDSVVVDTQSVIINKIDDFTDRYTDEPIDMNKNNETIELTIPEDGLILYPGILYIGRTVETTTSDKFIPMINGRSSIGRLGMFVHISAGFGDIGFKGTWTLEISVVEPLRIYPNTEIAQVAFFTPKGKISNLYNGRYQFQYNAGASKFYKK